MSDPFQVLGIPATATVEQIRSQYLSLVREFSPDRHPEKFAEIRAAYDELSNPQQQMRRKVFQPTEDSLEAVICDLQAETTQRRLPTESLLALGRSYRC